MIKEQKDEFWIGECLKVQRNGGVYWGDNRNRYKGEENEEYKDMKGG